jgi:RNA polymerase-binding transcription factor DksA
MWSTAETTMDTWENDAREALMQRRTRLQARGAQRPSPSSDEAVRLTEQDWKELRDIDDALARMNEGAFGQCSRCGGAIGRHRLRAIPEARYCLTCSALADR